MAANLLNSKPSDIWSVPAHVREHIIAFTPILDRVSASTVRPLRQPILESNLDIDEKLVWNMVHARSAKEILDDQTHYSCKRTVLMRIDKFRTPPEQELAVI